MDLRSPNYFEAPSLFASHGEPPLEGHTGFYKTSKDNPFVEDFPDPLCKLNLMETSEFVKSLPMANNGGVENSGFLEVSAQRRREGVTSVARRNVEAPSTPGRPIFSFGVGNLSKKSFPSKWDNAEKWLNSSSSCHDSPAHHHAFKPSESSKIPKQFNGLQQQQAELFAAKSKVTKEKVSNAASSFQGSLSLNHHLLAGAFNGISASADLLLKDRFTDEVEPIFPKFRSSEPMKEGFVFGNYSEKSMKDAAAEVIYEVKHKDVGTEMTPLGSSTTSRCHTPFKSSSPARHNTPANRSGPLALVNPNSSNTTIDITQLQECHLAKLQLGTQFDSVTSNWSSRQEEQEDILKSLRHFDISNECRRSVSESRPCAWEEKEKNKCCLRYQREEAKIQAWLNLQSAKAEAQSRKLEDKHAYKQENTKLDKFFCPQMFHRVKIQMMRSNLEEKLMKRMAVVHRKTEEWRAEAQLQHLEQIPRATEQARKIMNRQNSHFSGHSYCSCFPCNKHHH